MVGRNIQIDTRWSWRRQRARAPIRDGAGRAQSGRDPSGHRATVHPLQQASRTVPIVFAQLIDPVGAGNVETLARPNSNATGFLQFEYSLSAKWSNCSGRSHPKSSA